MNPFPDCILDVFREQLVRIDGVENIVLRMIESTDANGTLALVADEWVPIDYQIGSYDPALSIYKIVLVHLVKNTNAEEGNRTHRLVAKQLRLMLYRDEALRVALASLREGDSPIERVIRWEVTAQRFGSTELTGQNLHLSVTELQVYTETV